MRIKKKKNSGEFYLEDLQCIHWISVKIFILHLLLYYYGNKSIFLYILWQNHMRSLRSDCAIEPYQNDVRIYKKPLVTIL